jgi:predicted Zn finger-like uncharacterized protein
MNNNCPSCEALYNVAEKDIGRKIKCKKCGAALKVTEDGLVPDGGTGAAPTVSDPKPAAAQTGDADDEFDEDDEPVSKKKKNKDKDRGRDKDRGERGPGFNPTAALNAIGGIPTLLFGTGVFFVIFFTFMEEIGKAAILRAEAGIAKVMAEQNAKLRDLLPKGKTDRAELNDDEKKKYDDEADKIRKKFAQQQADAAEDLQSTRISNVRSIWMERYGLMFGFMFVAFGCLGYLRSEQFLVLRIVAGVILAVMMIVVFASFGGGCGGKSTPSIPIPGKGGKGADLGP